MESQGRALPLSFETSKDFRAGNMIPAAKTSQQEGQATKPPAARPHEMHHLGSSAMRLMQHQGWEKPPGEAGRGQ